MGAKEWQLDTFLVLGKVLLRHDLIELLLTVVAVEHQEEVDDELF